MVFIFLLVLIYSRSIVAQDPCGSPQALERHLKEVPGMRAFMDKYLSDLANRIKNFPFHPDLHRSAVTVPVVVHVIYKNATENISDANIQAQINIMNDAYRKRNTAANNAIPAAFKGYADDTYIQFRLASRDPFGKPTTGITRKSTTKGFYDSVGEEAKLPPYGVINWDPKRYLNIWVCDLRFSGSDGALGYSSFPWDTIKLYDGIVMDFGCFGPGSATANYQKGMVLVHESGHFFGLRHIWGDANCGDDFVSDTPTQQAPNFGDPTFPHVSCSNGPNGDMFMNHMDYVNDASKLMFTTGQRARMLANIAPGGTRASLAVSNGLFPASAVSRNYDVYLEPQNSNLPSWKAALVMVHAWSCQCSPALDNLLDQNKGKRGTKFSSMGNEIADAVYALALNPEEMLACYTIDGFYSKLSKGPIGLLSVGANEYYGLVISGMVIDQSSSRALLQIKDPMSIGPKGFFITNQKGAEYQVDYQEFMTQMLEQAVINNKHIYFIFPPSTL
ncbi:MAG TPA: zinc metalloprotease [Saprospiraceae bacterium]|nr:zinc metalloprotease [Saprospiraceae bacterium]